MSLFTSLFDPFKSSIPFEDPNAMAMNWKETRHAHIYEFEIPGLTKGDVKLQVHEGNVLKVSGCRAEETQEKGDTWHCRERTGGSFSREFGLPENAKVDEIKASMHDGVLVVTVPKDESKKKHKKREVEIAGHDEGLSAAKGLGRFVCCKA